MGILKLKNLAIVRDLKSAEEVDLVRDFLLTDPLKITHVINFWEGQKSNLSGTELAEVETIIKGWKQVLINQYRLTMSTYSIDAEEEVKVEATATVETKVEQTAEVVNTEEVDKSEASLRVVAKDGEDTETDATKALRIKYADIIKRLTIEGLRDKLKKFYSEDNKAEADELGNFILGEGLYKAKKAKKWATEDIVKFLATCQPEVVKTTEEVESTDPKVKYAAFLGENAPTVEGLKAECKFQIQEGNVDGAFELATLLLSEGLYGCVEGEPFRWSNAQIEDFMKSVRDSIKPADDPNVSAAGEKSQVAGSAAQESSENTAASTAMKDTSQSSNVAETVVKMVDFYKQLKTEIMNGMKEEEVKAYVFAQLKTNKVENLDKYYNVDTDPLELEDMYVKYFLSVVAENFKELANKNIDVKAAITVLVKAAVDAKEEGLGKIIGEAMKLYRQKGETVEGKECKDLVYAICEENHPEYWAELSKKLNLSSTKKKEEPAIAIVQPTDTFEKDHPEIWEEVKGAKTLKDVWDMATLQEKKQSFQVLSEMITHLISSGKINDTQTGLPLKWDRAQIENWINITFDPKGVQKNANKKEESPLASGAVSDQATQPVVTATASEPVTSSTKVETGKEDPITSGATQQIAESTASDGNTAASSLEDDISKDEEGTAYYTKLEVGELIFEKKDDKKIPMIDGEWIITDKGKDMLVSVLDGRITKVEEDKPDELGEKQAATTDQTSAVQPEIQSGQAADTVKDNAGAAQSQESGTGASAKTPEEVQAALDSVIDEEPVALPTGVVVPEEDKEFRDLYAKKRDGLSQGIANVIKALTAQGKQKKEIMHIIADKIKAIAKNDDLTQCDARNFKRTHISELYEIVNKLASKQGVEGWVIQ